MLAGFQARDHLGDPRRSIRENLDHFLAARGIDLGGGRVTMLAHARVLGYVFNPLTVYWCHRADGTLACVVAEVHNTYGQRHAYLLHTDDRGRAQVPKEFYVSPFYPVDGRYRMSLPEPDARLALSVVLGRPDGHSFAASVHGRGVPATRAGADRRRRTAPLVHGGRLRPDPLAGSEAVPARAAAGAAARSSTPGGGPVTSTSTQHAAPGRSTRTGGPMSPRRRARQYARPWRAPCSTPRWPGCRCGSGCRTAGCSARGRRPPRS